MTVNKFEKRTLVFLTILIVFTVFVYILNNNFLIFKAKDDSDNKILYARVARIGDSFTLKFRNSISKTFAEEAYTILGESNIVLNEFRYQSCDAGFPLGYEGRFFLEDGFMVIKYSNKIFQKLDNIRIAITYPHYIIFNDNDKDIYNLTESAAGHILSITVERIIKL